MNEFKEQFGLAFAWIAGCVIAAFIVGLSVGLFKGIFHL
jgi:hypothetical protein